MPLKFVKQALERLNIEFESRPSRPNLSDDIQQALARLLGYDNDNEYWSPVTVDNDGRLRVNVGGVTSVVASSSNPSIGVVSTSILATNPDRNSYIIFNNGSAIVFINFGEDASLTDGLPILPNTYFSDDGFRGAVNGIVAAGTCELRVAEFS